MKNKLVKSLIIVALILTVIVALLAIISAEGETYTVRYIANGEVKNTVHVSAGGKHIIRETKVSATQTGKTFYGWYTMDGKLYSGLDLGMEIIVDKDMDFYEAYGTAVQTKEDFLRCISQRGPGNYVRLSDNIVLDAPITLPASGLSVIDLNNYSLKLTTDAEAFNGTNAGIHIMDTSSKKLGSIIHESKGGEATTVTEAMFSLTPSGLEKNVSVVVFAPVKITTNVGFFKINSDISKSGYTFNFDINGTLNASYLVRSSGMKGATLDVSEATFMSLTGSRIFEDVGSNDGKVLTLRLDGGKYTIADKTVFTNEQDRYNLYLTAGRFNRDISALFKNGNYSFKTSTDAQYPYEFKECAHTGIATGISATCTKAGAIYYKCDYCDSDYSETSPALGHSNYKVLAKEPVTAVYPAQAGEYKTICQRCGHEATEYFYPEPKDVLIKVWTRNNDGTEKEHIVPSTMLFGEDVSATLKFYSTALFEYEYAIDQKNVIAIEIPMGVTELYGYTGTDQAKNGVFAGNDFLERIVLPESIEVLGKWTFAEMSNLKEIVNLEHVSREIQEGALQQSPESPLVMDHVVLNAASIRSRAFENVLIKTLTFGKEVTAVEGSAFNLDSTLTSQLVEIFIAEITENPANNSKFNHGTIYQANTKSSAFTNLGASNQFADKAIVYYGHDHVSVTTAPTCQAGGYDTNSCTRCGMTSIGNETAPIPHDFTIPVDIASTCKVQGYTANQCSMCEETTKHILKPLDLKNHQYDVKLYLGMFGNTPITDICTQDYREVYACDCNIKNHISNEYIFNWATLTQHKATGKHNLDYANPEESMNASCYQDGYQKLKCLQCSTIVEEVIPATNRHVYVLDSEGGVYSTCSQIGYILHRCSNAGCNATRKTPRELDPDNHEWSEWETIIEATPEKAGKAERHCTAESCDAKETKGIPVIEAVEKQGMPFWVILLIILGGVIVIALIVVLLYFTVFKKKASSDFQYTFDQRRQ